MVHGRVARSGSQLILKGFDALRRSFDHGFDASIIQISHEADDLMPRGGALRKKSKPDTLHVAADEKSSRYLVRHPGKKGSSILTRSHQLNNCDATGRNRYRHAARGGNLSLNLESLIAGPFISSHDWSIAQ